ncbi:MAG: hypothetical protein N2439_10890, partial [Anaerolineae bacterium]|nr:hypothetical protein [Anaerolineae bacterium]
SLAYIVISGYTGHHLTRAVRRPFAQTPADYGLAFETVSFLSRVDRLRLAGSKGVAEYQAATGVTVLSASSKPRVIENLPPARSLFVDFLESVYLGKQPGLTLAEILRVNRIVLLARQAAEEHRIVKLA